jgi:hypothetical protein
LRAWQILGEERVEAVAVLLQVSFKATVLAGWNNYLVAGATTVEIFNSV